MKAIITSIAFLIMTLTFYNCQSVESNAFKVKPKALGKMGEIVVVSDKNVWEGIVGDSLDYYLSGPFPVTPRPEPLFDLRNYTVEKLTTQPFLTELRTYLIVVNVNDEESAATKMLKKDLGIDKFNKAKSDPTFNSSIGKDKWASGQIIIYLFGTSHDAICKSLRENFNSITHRVHDHDNEQLKQMTFARGKNLGLTDTLSQRYGIKMDLPFGFRVAKDTDTIFWLRKELDDGAYSIAIKKLKYNNINQLSKSNFKSIRDEYGRAYVESTIPDDFMKTNDKDLPMLEYTIQIDGSYAKEYRGIWEMDKDFIGGPYTGYLIVNEEKGELLFIDGWVFAPGAKKRKYIRQLEYIIKSLEWNSSQTQSTAPAN